MDRSSQFGTYTSCSKYILVVVDYLITEPKAFLILDQETFTVAKMLVQQWVSRFFVRAFKCISVKGTNFNSAIFTGWCQPH